MSNLQKEKIMSTLSIGEKIRAVRREKHMTQRKLAELIGCKSSFVSHIEHNSRNVSLSYLRRIADALETPASRLVSVESDRLAKAIGILEDLDENGFKLALDYLEFLKQKQGQAADTARKVL